MQDARLPPHAHDPMIPVPPAGGLPCLLRAATDRLPGTTASTTGSTVAAVFCWSVPSGSSSSCCRCSPARSAISAIPTPTDRSRCPRSPHCSAASVSAVPRRPPSSRRPFRTPSRCCSVAVGARRRGAAGLGRRPAVPRAEGHADPGDAHPRPPDRRPGRRRLRRAQPRFRRGPAGAGRPAAQVRRPQRRPLPPGTPVYVVEALSDTAVEVVSTAPDPMPEILPEPGGNHP